MITSRNLVYRVTALICLSLLISGVQAQESPKSKKLLSWGSLPQIPPPPGHDIQLGLAGAFSGISNDALIIAGGANFPEPVWERTKEYHDDIYVLVKQASQEVEDGKEDYSWIRGFKLNAPIAYGASVSTNWGIVCMGGNDAGHVYSNVFLLQWDPDSKTIQTEALPGLPSPCTNGSATVIGNKIYLAGGQSGLELSTAMTNFWSLDLSKKLDYANLSPQEILNLADKRKIDLCNEERNKLARNSASEKELLTIIEKLKKSDERASHFAEWSNEQLQKEAKRRSLDTKNLNRAQLIRALQISQWGDFVWEELPGWPGPPRAYNITVAQYNGDAECVYVISGRTAIANVDGKESIQFLRDVYEFNLSNYQNHSYAARRGGKYENKGKTNYWKKCRDVPQCVMAGPGIAVGQSHIFILGGADGSLYFKADQLKDRHPGFPKKGFAFHTITNTWIPIEPLPENHVTTRAIKWDDKIVIPSGEVRPRVRSPKILFVKLLKDKKPFGALNFTILVIYLLGMVGVGLFFMKRNKDTNDFFRGGQRVPWWVAGCSIFATMLSSITYMAIPAKAYATNWTYLMSYPPIFLTAGFVVYFILPFFRRIDATSAYEYLEKRFNLVARLIGSSLFVFFQISRMAIVMFLSALALTAITPFTETQCILIMGLLSIIYCALGGVEAVVWTDTIQTFVLLGGAFLVLGIILTHIDGGIWSLFNIAHSDHKLYTIQWDWTKQSYMTTAFWVIFIGAFGQNLVSYTSDHAVVQRYLTTSDEKGAANAIWTNGIMSLFAGLLFFTLGTALYVFYKLHPTHLDPNFRTDAIIPLFISREIPVGFAGLIVAGIFAAAQSTISTSINSTATAIVTDFFRRFNLARSEKSYLNLARLMTIILGGAGTVFALLFVKSDIKSLFDSFLSFIGLFGGSLAGLFMLGIFTRRAHGVGAVIGAIAGAIVLYLVQAYTQIHVFLYALVGIITCMIVGYLVSLIIPAKSQSLEGLTIYSLHPQKTRGIGKRATE